MIGSGSVGSTLMCVSGRAFKNASTSAISVDSVSSVVIRSFSRMLLYFRIVGCWGELLSHWPLIFFLLEKSWSIYPAMLDHELMRVEAAASIVSWIKRAGHVPPLTWL